MFIDFLTVLVASIIFLLIDTFFYSSYMFCGYWEKWAKKTSPKNTWYRYLIKGIGIFFIGCLLAFFEELLKVSTFWDGVIAGIFLWLGLVFPLFLIMTLRYRMNFRLFLLDSGVFLWNLMVMGGILAG